MNNPYYAYNLVRGERPRQSSTYWTHYHLDFQPSTKETLEGEIVFTNGNKANFKHIDGSSIFTGEDKPLTCFTHFNELFIEWEKEPLGHTVFVNYEYILNFPQPSVHE